MSWLTSPLPGRSFRLISIDPGSDTVGIAISELDFERNTIHFVHVVTFECSKLARRDKRVGDIHGDKVGRLWALEKLMHSLLEAWEVDVIASEAPFLGRFATAYAALVECIKVIRSAVFAYDIDMPLHLYDPPSVKLAVGAPGKTKDKSLIPKGIKKLSFVTWASDINIDTLDEHSTDAMAVGIAHARRLLEV